jgi:hypothetical protein
MSAATTPDEVNLAHVACDCLGIDHTSVTPLKPGKFLDVALEALEEELHLACELAAHDEVGAELVSGFLTRIHRRLGRAREIAPLIDRMLARDTIKRLTEFSAERRAAHDPVASRSLEERMAQIRAAFPDLDDKEPAL